MTTTAVRNPKPEAHDSEARPGLQPVPPDTTHEQTAAQSFDPTQGSKIGSDPYDDPTQGSKIGSDPYDDPTRVRP
jgi:hypothetical protein